MKLHIATAVAVVAALVGASASERDHDAGLVARDVYLMGTRATLVARGATRQEGLDATDLALRVLEHAEEELSTWRADSAISALNVQPIGRPWHAGRLCELFAEVYAWRAATGGTFDPAIGQLLSAWGVHQNGRVPTAEEISKAHSRSGLPLVSFDRDRCMLTRLAEVTIDTGAFGKGEALDRVERALGATSWMIDLGGQVSVHGPGPDQGAWAVGVAHPLTRTRSILNLRLQEGSLSTSAGSERDLVVKGVRVGHILDPRTGYPAPFQGSVTVWHRSGLVADILSTALYVMGPVEGLRWAEGRDLTVCYLIPSNGDVQMLTTTGFRRLLVSSEAQNLH